MNPSSPTRTFKDQLQRTVYFAGLHPRNMRTGSQIRSLLEQTEDGITQIVNFAPFEEGVVIEYLNVRSATKATSLVFPPGSHIAAGVPATATVDSAYDLERRRLCSQTGGETVFHRHDIEHERTLRHAAQRNVFLLDSKVHQLSGSSSTDATDSAVTTTTSTPVHRASSPQRASPAHHQHTAEYKAIAAQFPDYVRAWQHGTAAYCYFDVKTIPAAIAVGAVDDDAFRLTCLSPDDTPMVVQGDRPLQCIPGCNVPVGYYEVTILELGAAGCTVAVGVAPEGFCGRGHQPGWSANSYGFHGDDGCVFWNTSDDQTLCHQQPVSGGFNTGDVIGCGLLYSSKELFVTRNGALLGVVATAVTGAHWPTVGIASMSESVHVNFGVEPFVFNVWAFAQSSRR
eukprot:TRINITY_DN6657_c0_g1_i1.p1 TRINITY_DN6657_c0_g1~~TRINITY_DN6657_c0_g1_i1.p1  ORF type:complete len:398 (-),score=96.07 TRINITY_DN6657_c0_g1_i1:1260-2453(-)